MKFLTRIFTRTIQRLIEYLCALDKGRRKRKRKKGRWPISVRQGIMKKIIILLLFIIIAFSLPVMVSSDAKVLLRALSKTDGANLETIMMPSWMADLKLTTIGIGHCTLSFADKNDTASVINFLVAAYAGEEVSNSRVVAYITRFVKQGCSIDDYDQAGMTPLHAAVLFGQPDLLKILLKNNADTTKQIRRKGKRVDGMQALQFAKFLFTSNITQERQDVINILQTHKAADK